MAVHKLYKLKNDSTSIAGTAVLGNGTVSVSESAQTVSPSGGLRSGRTCVVSIVESMTFQIEDATTASIPAIGSTGSTTFAVEEMSGGTARAAGPVCTAAKTTVTSVRRGFNIAGQPTVDVEVAVESADEIASGLVWTSA